MMEQGKDDRDGGRGPLNYRSGREEVDPYVEGVKNGAKLTVGFILGGIGVIVVGFFSAMLVESTGEFQFRSVPLAVAYFLAAVAGVGACGWGLWRPPRRWFLAGLLLGGALASLMEGACFTSG